METSPSPLIPQKKAAFFDLDNTLIDGSSSYYFARQLLKTKEIRSRELIRFALQNFNFRVLKREDSRSLDLMIEKLSGFVRTKSQKRVKKICENLAEDILARRSFPGMLERIEEHKAVDHDTWIVTAAPMEIAEVVAKSLKMAGAIGTKSKIYRGVYTGELKDGLMHGMNKAKAIIEIAKKRNYDLGKSFAYSDSINDLHMLVTVGKPAVVNANKELQTIALKNQWPIIVT